MITALENAVERAAKLPERQQTVLAAIIVEEIESEKLWDEQFGRSQDVLARLAESALGEFDAGKTKPVIHPRDLSHD